MGVAIKTIKRTGNNQTTWALPPYSRTKKVRLAVVAWLKESTLLRAPELVTGKVNQTLTDGASIIRERANGGKAQLPLVGVSIIIIKDNSNPLRRKLLDAAFHQPNGDTQPSGRGVSQCALFQPSSPYPSLLQASSTGGLFVAHPVCHRRAPTAMLASTTLGLLYWCGSPKLALVVNAKASFGLRTRGMSSN